MAMARMAYTELSRPDEVPDSTTVAGPVSEASAISCTGPYSVPVKYSVRRLATWARTRPTTTAPKHFQPGVGVVVADVDQRQEQRADHGEDAGGEEAAVDGR